jgi:hypothetical protein
MKSPPLVPDGFAIGMLLSGFVLLVFPSLRVAGLLAVLSAVAYWLIVAVTKFARR